MLLESNSQIANRLPKQGKKQEESTNLKLRFERQKVLLIADHKIVTKTLMLLTITAMLAEVGFAIWCMVELSKLCDSFAP